MNRQQIIFVIFLVLAAIFFQTAWLPNFFPSGAVPSLSVALVVFYTFRFGFEKIWIKIFFFGIVFDLLNFSWLGLNSLALIMVAFVSSFLSRRFLVIHANWRFFILVFLVLAGTVTNEIVLFGIPVAVRQFWGKNGALFFSLNYQDLVKKTLGNLAIIFILYWPLIKLEKFVKSLKRGSLS
jgi:hypothetical protein